jgi:hypothetical protein
MQQAHGALPIANLGDHPSRSYMANWFPYLLILLLPTFAARQRIDGQRRALTCSNYSILLTMDTKLTRGRASKGTWGLSETIGNACLWCRQSGIIVCPRPQAPGLCVPRSRKAWRGHAAACAKGVACGETVGVGRCWTLQQPLPDALEESAATRGWKWDGNGPLGTKFTRGGGYPLGKFTYIVTKLYVKSPSLIVKSTK